MGATLTMTNDSENRSGEQYDREHGATPAQYDRGQVPGFSCSDFEPQSSGTEHAAPPDTWTLTPAGQLASGHYTLTEDALRALGEAGEL